MSSSSEYLVAAYICIGVSGRKLHHVELTYDPIRCNAVACNDSHIFVADSAPGGGVHIHTWSGQHIQSLSRHQLGLQEDDTIWAIHYSSPDMTLQLAIGDCDSGTVNSLHACKV